MIQPLLHYATLAIEITGVLVILAGAAIALFLFLQHCLKRSDSQQTYRDFRARLGRSILLGLEFLVAADIINTVAIEPSLQSVAVLAGVVLIRTFLSFALEMEIEGRLPWRREEKAQR